MEEISSINEQYVQAEDSRHLASFRPGLWEETFLNYGLPDPHQTAERRTRQEIEGLKDEVRKELLGSDKDPKERLMYIDAIQRLGVPYHFDEEIEANLNDFLNMKFVDDCYKNDLHYVSLRFRLLRQHGFYVPSGDVFGKFKNEVGSFKEFDVQSTLSFYEASHLGVHGEDTLDDAVAYTRARLESLFASDLNCSMTRQVIHALELPLFRRSPRLESTYHISIYELEPSHDKNLLRLAKLDFNSLQSLHKKEMQDLLRWSKSLELSKKFPYARERLVEAKVWLLGVYYESEYSYARIASNKLFKIISIIDDTYDAYGTIQELQLFTDAIQRWDKSSVSQLPDYMKYLYEVILSTCDEFEKKMAKEGRAYAVDYVRNQMRAMCRAYMQEAKWCHEKYVPTFEEYMRNGIVSSGYFYVITSVYLGMDIATKHAFEWVYQSSKSVKASCVLARLLNDITSHKFEQSRGHVASAVECYMKQFGVTQEKAYEQLLLQVEDAWKDLKEDMFRQTGVGMSLMTRVLNLSRTLHDVYGAGEDGYTMNQYMQAHIGGVLKNPIT